MNDAIERAVYDLRRVLPNDQYVDRVNAILARLCDEVRAEEAAKREKLRDALDSALIAWNQGQRSGSYGQTPYWVGKARAALEGEQ